MDSPTLDDLKLITNDDLTDPEEEDLAAAQLAQQLMELYDNQTLPKPLPPSGEARGGLEGSIYPNHGEATEEPFEIEKVDGIFVITGKAVERLMGRVNIADNESLYYFHKCLSDLGVDEKLKEMGIKAGDTVKIIDYELEWE